MARLFTTCIIQRGDEVLLGLKKHGFGVGLWNGFGGKVLAGEAIEDAARRELEEETGLRALTLDRCGIFTFNIAEPHAAGEVHVFSVTAVSGELRETNEMSPRWFSVSALPYGEMWSDGRHWLPLVITGKKFRAHFRYQDIRTMVEANVDEVLSFD